MGRHYENRRPDMPRFPAAPVSAGARPCPGRFLPGQALRSGPRNNGSYQEARTRQDQPIRSVHASANPAVSTYAAEPGEDRTAPHRAMEASVARPTAASACRHRSVDIRDTPNRRPTFRSLAPASINSAAASASVSSAPARPLSGRHLRDTSCPCVTSTGSACQPGLPRPGQPASELRGFAKGLRKDWAAVTAGLTLPYSSGAVEGHVNRIILWNQNCQIDPV